MDHFTLKDLPGKAKTLDIELKIKHVSAQFRAQ